MSDKNQYVAIMAGGIGSRFWPHSRVKRPKQFLDILGTGKSLLQATFERFEKVVPKENIYIVTSRAYVDLVKEQLPQIADEQILGEPLRRNTAPCIAYVTNKIHKRDPKATVVVAPSDHIILNESNFVEVIKKGLDFVKYEPVLCTLGIKPSRPDTGYGYIQYIEEHERNEGIYKVKTFTEKPNLGLAKQFLASGDFIWNSGIFIWSIDTINTALHEHLPVVMERFDEGMEFYNTDKEQEFIDKVYTHCENISIDYGVMEKAENVFVIPANFGWSDLGTWTSLWENHEKDAKENALSHENIMVYDASENIIVSNPDKLVVVQGLEGYCVVDSDEILMICRKQDEQQLKEINGDVRRTKGEKFL